MFDFDDSEVRYVDGRRLTNYWGYSTSAFFAPHAGYCATPELGQHVREFRDMVKALHSAGIEVILDVVFNHTDEGNHLGPLYSFAGLDNRNYYYLDPADPRYYYDYSGCGNTLMGNHPIVTKLIVDCLEYWVREMHVDGFRFDEAAVLTRGADGEVLDEPPVIWQIELSDTLADTKIIAEAWDAAGAYEVGRYPGYRWAEWNGRYRDTMRRFVKGEPGIVGEVAARLTGSADLYQARGHRPTNSINFVTCHDGFTLADLVSYNEQAQLGQRRGQPRRQRRQHELELRRRGPDRRPGRAGAAGPADPQLRHPAACSRAACRCWWPATRSAAPSRATTTPTARTTRSAGSTGAWSSANQDLLRFWRQLIAFRRAHRVLRRREFYTGLPNRPRRAGPDLARHAAGAHPAGTTPRRGRWPARSAGSTATPTCT